MREALSIVVIAHVNRQTLAFCLDSAELVTSPNDELILVLNNPDAQTKSLSLNRPRWNILNESRPGPQFARNCGAASAKNKIICFLDADIILPAGWLEQMLSNFDDPWVVAGQSKIHQVKSDGLLNWIKRFQYLRFNSRFYFPDGLFQVQSTLLTLDTAALMVKKSWFSQVGGFDEEFSRMEDSDLTLRLMYAGGDLFFEDRVIAMEMNDQDEGIWDLIRKQYLSVKLLPKFYIKHFIDFRFIPFPGSSCGIHSSLNILPFKARVWLFILDLIYFAGIANSSHHLGPTVTRYFNLKPNSKRVAMLGEAEKNYRKIWVGGKKRWFNLIHKTFSKNI